MTCTFKITPAAVDALTAIIMGISKIDQPVLAPIFSQGNAALPRWSIGIYEKENLVRQNLAIMKEGSFEFYIDPSVLDLLSAKTFDYIDGRFEVF
jgi:hypothetical protein